MRRASLLGVAAIALGAPTVAAQTPGGTADASVERSTPRTISPDTLFFAEGIDIDPRDGTLYVTSLWHRNVYRVGGDGVMRPVLAANAPAIAAPFGVRVDTLRGLLWLATAVSPPMRGASRADGARAELVAVRAADGTIADRWPLGDGTGTPGEIALAPDGTVLVSDGAAGALHRLRVGARAMETVRHELLRSPQGIAVDARSEVAWVADWSRGLRRWDLRTDTITPVETADGARLLGIDGLVRARDGTLIGVQNGARMPRIVAVTLDATGGRIVAAHTLDRPVAYEGEPTVGALIGDRYLFVSSSAWPFWTDAGVRRAEDRPLPPVVIRELRLSR